MSTDVQVYRADLPMSTEQVRDHVNAIQKIMEAVMKKDVHYGIVPGSKKPSLWKPGAEVLGTTFRIAPSFQIEDLSGPRYYRYRVRCIGTHQGSGIVLGEGLGSCSSNEEKYKWRRISANSEWDATPESDRRIKYTYSKEYKKEFQVRQVRAEADDIENTILKMACKRAQIAMIINVTAAGDIFAQDIEDLPDHLRDEDMPESKPPVEQPRAKPKAAATQKTPDTERGSSADMGDQSARAPDNAWNERPSGGSPLNSTSAAAPKTASPPPSQSSAPSAASAGDAVHDQRGAPADSGDSAQARTERTDATQLAPHPIEGELLPRENAPTLSDCLALADKACEEKRLGDVLPTLAEYRKSLSAEDQARLDSTLKALMADQGTPAQNADLTPPMSAGQLRIIKARLKSNNKTIEALEKEMGCPLDQIPFTQFEKAQAWASAT